MANDEILSHPLFWDERYAAAEDAPSYEWFRSFGDLEAFFDRTLFQVPGRRPADNPMILHLGSGDSTIPAELDARGYGRQLCVDFSAKAIEMMAERHADKPQIRWAQMDVRDMAGVATKSIDVAFDKGTLDAMIHGSPWSPPADVWENTGRYLGEVYRVLGDEGVFLYVTFRQPRFVRPLLNPDGRWDLSLQVLGGTGGSFDYYGWVIRKVGKEDKKRGEK